MQHATTGLDPYRITGQLGPPAEIDLLHVGEEIAVEPSQRAKHVGSDGHAGARCPEHLARIVVLSLVGLDRIEYAAATERIAQKIDEPAGRTGILELVRLAERADFRRHGGDRPVAVERADQRIEPPLGHFDIGIEQYEILGVQPGERPVVSLRIAVVAVEPQQFDLRITTLEETDRIVGRAVVGHDDPRARRARNEGGKKALQIIAPVPVQYDDFYSGHASGILCVSVSREWRMS